MSMAIGHFALGAALTAILLDAVLRFDSFRRTGLVLGGIWAVLPDVHWVLPGYNPTIRAVHDSAAANLFWFHGVLDTVDGSNSRPAAAALVGVAVVVIIVLDWYGDGAPLLSNRSRQAGASRTK